MATTKKRTSTAAKPVTRAKARSTSKGVASSRSKARRDTDLAPIVRFTPKEWAAYLERQTQREMGISVAEFRRAYAAGELKMGTWPSTISSAAPDRPEREQSQPERSQSCRVAPRRAWRRASPRHLNRVLNLTVSDSHLSVSPVTGDGDDDTFELERLVERENVPLELYGTTARLSVQQVVLVKDGRCKTKSYVYRFQADESLKSWLMRWEYRRKPPRRGLSLWAGAHAYPRNTP